MPAPGLHGANPFNPNGDQFAPISQPTNTGGATIALDLTLGAPLTNISAPSSVMEAGATEWIAALVTLTDMMTGRDIYPDQFPVFIAITQATPQESDYQPATWGDRAVAPTGSYALIFAGPGAALNPGAGHWRVYVQILAGGETLVGRCPGSLTVE